MSVFNAQCIAPTLLLPCVLSVSIFLLLLLTCLFTVGTHDEGPMSGKPLRIKDLIAVNFKLADKLSKESLAARKERYVCALTDKVLRNAVPCVVLKPTGQFLCTPAHQLLSVLRAAVGLKRNRVKVQCSILTTLRHRPFRCTRALVFLLPFALSPPSATFFFMVSLPLSES